MSDHQSGHQSNPLCLKEMSPNLADSVENRKNIPFIKSVAQTVSESILLFRYDAGFCDPCACMLALVYLIGLYADDFVGPKQLTCVITHSFIFVLLLLYCLSFFSLD